MVANTCYMHLVTLTHYSRRPINVLYFPFRTMSSVSSVLILVTSLLFSATVPGANADDKLRTDQIRQRMLHYSANPIILHRLLLLIFLLGFAFIKYIQKV